MSFDCLSSVMHHSLCSLILFCIHKWKRQQKRKRNNESMKLPNHVTVQRVIEIYDLTTTNSNNRRQNVQEYYFTLTYIPRVICTVRYVYILYTQHTNSRPVCECLYIFILQLLANHYYCTVKPKMNDSKKEKQCDSGKSQN